jgi:RimJ/RimL family protein N-acetyltransferase
MQIVEAMDGIQTTRLDVRPMRPEDVQPLFAVFGDPIVMRAFDRGPFTVAEMQAWVARNLEHQDRYGYGLFAIVLRETAEIIGDCGLERLELDGIDEVELGYDLRSDHWGRGFATEAASAVKEHAREALELPRLISLVRSGNDRSARVAERIGMSVERQIHQGETAYSVFAIDLTYPDR